MERWGKYKNFNVNKGPGKTAQRLRAHIPLSEDQSSSPKLHAKWLPVTCDWSGTLASENATHAAHAHADTLVIRNKAVFKKYKVDK